MSYVASQSDPDPDPSSLESKLHSFLSTDPGGLARSRKSRPAPADGPPIRPATKPADGTEAPARERGEKKEAGLQKEKWLENESKAEKLLGGGRSGLPGDPRSPPRGSDRAPHTPATPRTPRPTTRDYYFGHGGELGSPWTILSPLTSGESRLRRKSQRTFPSVSSGDDLDGVWGNNEADQQLLSPSDQDGFSPPSRDPLLDYPGPRSRLNPPVRSASANETTRSPTSGFSLGDLFQRSMCQRSYSHESRTETLRAGGVRSAFGTRSELDVGKASSSGIISFFRRIGGTTQAHQCRRTQHETT